MVLGWTSTGNVSEQMQPSCRDKVGGWRLAGPASDFVVRDLCSVWNTQDMTEAPLVKSINWSACLIWPCIRLTVCPLMHRAGTSMLGSCEVCYSAMQYASFM